MHYYLYNKANYNSIITSLTKYDSIGFFTMLSALFKPAWQSSSVEKRLRFVNEIKESSQENLEILKKLIHSDSELSVREAALGKISEPSLIFDVIKTHSDGQTRDKAIALFSHLTGPKSELSESEFKSLILKHPETTLSIAKSCPHSELRIELIDKLSINEQVDLLGEVDYSETRLYISEKINTEDLLEKARKNLKGKDKNAEKIIKNKLNAIHTKQKQDEENLEKSESLCDTMEYLSAQSEWRNEFKDRFHQCEREWNALDFTPGDYLIQRYASAKHQTKTTLDSHEKIEEAQKLQITVAEILAKECKNIADFSIEELLAQTDKLNNLITENQNNWKTSIEICKPEKALWKNFETSSKSIESVLKFAKLRLELNDELTKVNQDTDTKELTKLNKKYRSILATLDWSKELQNLTVKEEALNEVDAIQAIADKQNKEASDKLDKLHQRINRLQGSTKRGDLAQARRELTAVIKISQRYTGKDKTSLDERLEEATEAVDKMADWKNYATAPKFIELCENMEALSPEALLKSNKSNMSADKLATNITKLQKDWKALGFSDSAEEHWERFNKASDVAYAPCDEFFKQRQKVRKNNLADREPLVTQAQSLVSQTNWQDNNECKKALNSIRKIDESWKKIKDVEPGPGTKQWKRLRKAKNSVYEKLDEVYAVNIAFKNELITKSKELLETEVTENTLNTLQSLQSQWKEIGITKRKADQKAWEEFKSTTDAVFEKIKDLRKAKRSAEDEQLKPYRDVIKSIQHLSKSAKNLAEADSNFTKYQTEHDALPPMPRGVPEKVVEGIKKDYQRACGDFDRTRERILQNKKHQALDNLAAKATLCSDLEALTTDATQVEVDDVKAQIDALEITDNELKKRFSKRLDVARVSERKAYTETRKLMCINLEILLGKDSPAEDKSQRMQLQLERMQQGGFGQDRVEKDVVLKKMKLDWYCLPGADPAMQKKLDERFKLLIK